jgi:hypothetical protein
VGSVTASTPEPAHRRVRSSWSLALGVWFALSGCGTAPDVVAAPLDPDPPALTTVPPLAPRGEAGTAPPAPTTTALSRPHWLGQRPLPLDERGFGQILATPPELVDRRLPPPENGHPRPGEHFRAAISVVPPEVLARSTWDPACPVDAAALRYVMVSFWGFDERAHTGELLVHTEVADDLVEVFRRLFDARFPIEEMRITRPDELTAAPTGDGNNTSAFVCRPAVGSRRWSQHAYGLAVDINPFHNPYQRDGLVLPELASAYLDRDDVRPGMILRGDIVTTTFAELGWEWGGDWRSFTDPHHFSRHGG